MKDVGIARIKQRRITGRKAADICFTVINYFILSFIALACIFPFYYILIYSISIPERAEAQAFFIFPQGFSLESYVQVFGAYNILYSAFISVSRSVIGTIITVICTPMFAFALTQSLLKYRKLIYRLAVFTMFFNVGLIPWYMLMRTLGLKDSFFLYVIPSAIVAFYLVLIKVYIEQLPASLQESAVIDGANPFTIFTRIIFPVCKPVLATIAVFSAVGQWNTWWDNFLLARNLPTLQYILLLFVSSVEANLVAQGANYVSSEVLEISPKAIRMAITVIVVFPIMLVYPYLQRYFIKGIMIGSVKG